MSLIAAAVLAASLTSIGPPGASVKAIAVDPRDSSVAYVATEGGVFKTTNAGTRWHAVTSGMDILDVRAVLIDPKTPSRIYGGGDAALFRSENGGETWRRASDGDAWVLASDGPTLYIGDAKGVSVSRDHGKTRQTIRKGPPTSISVQPESHAIYVAHYGELGEAGAWRSDDGGKSWTQISKGRVRQIAADPSKKNVVYFLTDYDLWRSEDMGATATSLIGSIPKIHTAFAVEWDTGTVWLGTRDGMYVRHANAGDWEAAPPYVFIDSIGATPAIVYTGTEYYGVYTDGGGRFAKRQEGLTASTVHSFALDPRNGGVIFATTPLGPFQSRNGGATWTQLGSDSLQGLVSIDLRHNGAFYVDGKNGLHRRDGGGPWISQQGLPADDAIVAMAYDSAGDAVYAAAEDSHIYKSTGEGTAWSRIDSRGLPLQRWYGLAVDPSDRSVLFVSGLHGIFKSSDGGKHWAWSGEGIPDGESAHEILMARESSSMFVRVGNGIYVSRNRGRRWELLPLRCPLSRAVAMHPRKPSELAAVCMPYLYRSSDGGEHWRMVDLPQFLPSGISGMQFNPASDELYIATYGAGILVVKP